MDWQCCLGRCGMELKPVSGQSACQALLSSKVLAGIWRFILDGDSRKIDSDTTSELQACNCRASAVLQLAWTRPVQSVLVEFLPCLSD